MLESPSIRWYSFSVKPSTEDEAMSSENPSGADNQQETARDPQRLHAEHTDRIVTAPSFDEASTVGYSDVPAYSQV